MANVRYTMINGTSFGFWALLGLFGALIAAGLGATYYMEHNGHWVTGMNNAIVWGLPHVFAVFLIVAASGALNVSSMATVFGRTMYKPLSRLSNMLAMTLLLGGLAVLMLDLGRPDRLIVAMTKYNLTSIFAWNIVLYSGFFGLVGLYLWTMMEKKMNRYSKAAGMAAFIWRLILTTGTGSIFGFVVARQAYDAAIMAPMFIIMSFAYGLAFYMLFLMASYKLTGRELGDAVVNRMKNLLGVFVAASLYFVVVYHMTNLYMAEHGGFEFFILFGENGGSSYSKVFWIYQVLLGAIVPMIILFTGLSKSRTMISIASLLVIFGGLAQMYVTIIAGQAYPLTIFPGWEVTSSFGDGAVTQYSASKWELMLGMSGIGIVLAATTFAIKVLPLLPESLSDKVADPHYKAG